jgi:hypothetical protein
MNGTIVGRASISDVFSLYDRALSQTKGRLEESVAETTKELEKFYAEFLKNHIINFSEKFKNEGYRRELHRALQQRCRSTSLRFWAVDGACKKIDTSDLAIFYGGAYVVKGRLGLQDNPPLLSYEESEPEDDSSIVAYLPLSAEDLTIINPEDRFVVNDAERISLSGLDTSLMLLAEIFLLYRGASGVDRPHLLLWDHSLSSILANATPNIKELHFAGIEIGGETIWYPDLLVGYSKPWNNEMDVPSKKSHRLWERYVARLYTNEDHSINISGICDETGLGKSDVVTQIKLIWECDKFGRQREGGNPESALVRKDGDRLQLNEAYLHSPEKITRLFEYFCGKLYREKDPSILLHDFVDTDGSRRKKFLSAEEISFLMAIGLRLTFEHCWRNGTMLIGVVKDSATTYYTRNYFGVMKAIGKLDFVPRRIPTTDRMTLERLPYIDDKLEGPWASTEFDGVFMTLRLRREIGSETATLQGVRGFVLVQPNLVMRSLVQFHLVRQSEMELSMGHVIFVDRLVHPDSIPEKVTVIKGDPDLGTLEPFFYLNSKVKNKEQEYAIYLLSVLTRNVFPEVIGYPDPLHLADRGAKAVLKMVLPMLISSEQLNRSNPLHRTLRQLRGG